MPERFLQRRQEKGPTQIVRRLTREELVRNARQDFGSLYSTQNLETFIDNRVTGLTVNGVDIISIDFDHKAQIVDPITHSYLRSPRTSLAVPEYFEPDLDRHNVYSERITSTVKKYSPTGLSHTHEDRLHFAQQIAEACQYADVPVAVTDIANRPLYMAYRQVTRTLPSLAADAYVAATLLDNPYIAIPLMAVTLAWSYVTNSYESDKAKGIFNKDKVGKFEHLIIDMEQARRLYLAKGVGQLIEEQPLTNPRSQVVALYPKAHSIRMEDMLLNPHPVSGTARNLVFKTIAPRLDYSIRKWHFDKNQKEWVLYQEDKIKM